MTKVRLIGKGVHGYTWFLVPLPIYVHKLELFIISNTLTAQIKKNIYIWATETSERLCELCKQSFILGATGDKLGWGDAGNRGGGIRVIRE